MTHSLPQPGHEIVVSGSISNLGPAFDALSVAVGVFLRVRILDVEPDRPGRLDIEFAGGSPGRREPHLTGFQRAQARFRRRHARPARAGRRATSR